jgi:citrate lyase subunit gamma (acyl carrier protein)
MKKSSAGTLESGDILIEISPMEKSGAEITLQSIVAHQFGRKIKAVIRQTLKEMDVDGVSVNAIDKGALDCTVKARVATAVMRARGDQSYNW